MKRQRHVCPCPACKEEHTSPTAEWHRAINEAVFHAAEKNRRLVAGLEALRAGRGGISRVSEITGMARRTIARGIRELREGRAPEERDRREGGGRWKAEKKRSRRASAPEESDEG